jgi:maltose O-acetyltransferase
MKTRFKNLIKSIVGLPLSSLHWYAREAIFFAERRALMRKMGHCEPDLAVSPPWDIRGEENIFIGQDVYVGPHVLMLADKGAEIHIGNNVMLGPQVKLIANDHRFDDLTRPIKHSGYGERTGIQVGNDVWIGTGAIILKGIGIGDGSVIGAGSVVTRDVGSCEVWAGNPARKINQRFSVPCS